MALGGGLNALGKLNIVCYNFMIFLLLTQKEVPKLWPDWTTGQPHETRNYRTGFGNN